MKRLSLLTFLLFSAFVHMAASTNVSGGQGPDGSRVIEKTFHFPAEHFPISLHESRHHTHHSFWPVNDKSYVWLSGGVRDDVGIPWLVADIELQPYEELVDFSFEKSDENLFLDDAMVEIVGRTWVLAEDYPSNKEDCVKLTGIGRLNFPEPNWLNGWCKMSFLICPFRFEASSRRLYLSENVTLRIRVRQHDYSYHAFIEEGKTWIYGRAKDGTGQGESNGSYDELEYLYFGGDTIIGGKRCKLWMSDSHSLVDPAAPIATRLLAPVFEESQQVFFFYPGEVTPRLLFDFSERGREGYITVFHITSSSSYPQNVFRDGGVRVYSSNMYITPGIFYEQPRSWLEGVGGTWYRSYSSEYDGVYRLLLCQASDRTLYCRSWEYEYITGIEDMYTNKGHLSDIYSKSADGYCYDLTGRRLAAPPARGLYIKDGRVRVSNGK